MHDLLINISLTKVAECLDLCLPVIDEGRDVEELVVVGPGLLELAQGLVGLADVGRGPDLRSLVPDPLTNLQVQEVIVQCRGVLTHGLVHATEARGCSGLTRLVIGFPEIFKVMS